MYFASPPQNFTLPPSHNLNPSPPHNFNPPLPHNLLGCTLHALLSQASRLHSKKKPSTIFITSQKMILGVNNFTSSDHVPNYALCRNKKSFESTYDEHSLVFATSSVFSKRDVWEILSQVVTSGRQKVGNGGEGEN